MRLLPILAASCFVSSMSMRIVDPVVPDNSRDLGVDPASVAMLASFFAFPYALAQPVLGAMGDAFGKARIIKIALSLLVLCLATSAIAPTLDTLSLARLLGGAAAGGIIPLAFAIVGDPVCDDRAAGRLVARFDGHYRGPAHRLYRLRICSVLFRLAHSNGCCGGFDLGSPHCDNLAIALRYAAAIDRTQSPRILRRLSSGICQSAIGRLFFRGLYRRNRDLRPFPIRRGPARTARRRRPEGSRFSPLGFWLGRLHLYGPWCG